MNDVERRVLAGVADRLENVFYETMPNDNRYNLRAAISELQDFAVFDRLPWPRWIDHAERTGDMDPEYAIELIREVDGDVIISIVRDSEGHPRHCGSVQFCTSGQGGGQSPNVHRALCDLMVAIEADSKARPIVEHEQDDPNRFTVPAPDSNPHRIKFPDWLREDAGNVWQMYAEAGRLSAISFKLRNLCDVALRPGDAIEKTGPDSYRVVRLGAVEGEEIRINPAAG